MGKFMGQQYENLQAEIDDLDVVADAFVEEEIDETKSVSEEDGQTQEEPGEEERTDSADDRTERGQRDQEADTSEENAEGDSDTDGGEVSGRLDQTQLTAIDELAKLQAENAKMKAQLESQQTDQTEQTPAEPEFSFDPNGIDYVGDIDLYQLTSDKETFNGFLQNFAKQVIETAYNSTSKGIMLNVPKIVESQHTQMTRINDAVNTFYKDNSDLVDVKPQVAQVAQMVANENPGLKMEEVFAEAATRTRRLLGMPTKEQLEKEQESFVPPKGRSPKGKRQTRPQKISALQAEIDEL